jgi:2-amino-4-hydroxy-6-hydroxymethyldihydropteridine diphosphokinase
VKTVYLSLGSNIGDREANLRAAIERLTAAAVEVRRQSRIYETEPVGFADQRWFLNMAVEAATGLFPLQLLTRIGKIEQALGRVRTIPNGPRTIDIDILLYGSTVMSTARLEIPHPRMHQRRFVLAPMVDLAPDLRHPQTHQTMRQLLDAAPPEVIRVVGS